MATNGYVLIEVPEHPRSRNGWVYEHTLVAESEYGLLRPWETVHHINEIKCDNDIENLFVCDRSWHDHAHNMASVSHRKMNNSQKGKACEGCGKVFYGKPHAIKRRRFCHAGCRRMAA
jgi:hypothetical protein